MNVLVIQRRLTAYRVPLFEQVRALLAERGIQLSVAYGTPGREEQDRKDEGVLSWGIPTQTRYLTLLGRRLAWTHVPRAIVARQDLLVVAHENGILSNYPLLVRARFGGPPVAWWGHGPKLLGARVAVEERAKGVSARWGVWYFAYTEESVRRVLKAGVPADRVTCLDNAVERDATLADGSEWDAARARLREELGLGDGPVAVHLGSLTPEKRISTLLRAGDALARKLGGFRMLVVGDGPQREAVLSASATRPWLRWVGARHGREKALICSVGHVMLNPGMVGLNIVDAFATGLPLVTMRHDRHSPEISYLEEGRNGLMTEDDLDAFVAAAHRALTDATLRETLLRGCRESAERYTLERMARNFAGGVEAALRSRSRPDAPGAPLPTFTVAVVIRSLLPYHVARLRRLRAALRQRGIRLCEIEVASRDAAYGFSASDSDDGEDRFCCFPRVDYQTLRASEIRARVGKLLETLRPDVVIGHATPFPEGMAAIAYRNRTGARVYVVDDAWAATDRSSGLVRMVKRIIHRSVDGAIVSSATHVLYYAGLGVPEGRASIGCSVVDNEFYASRSEAARRDEAMVKARLGLPARYFLFVGRFLERKGISRLLEAHDRYRAKTPEPWPLVLVGGRRADLPAGLQPSGAVHFAGRLFGEDLAAALGLAGATIVPSLLEQWGLVINEAMASGTPIIVSRACGGAHLVREGESGWTYEPDDVASLAELLGRVSSMTEDARAQMGRAAQRDISDWGLDRFVDAVFQALRTPRRTPAGIASRAAVRLWKGRVRAY